MAGIVPNVAELTLLARVLVGTIKVRLYKNDLTPGPSTVLADFVAATFPGYADQVMQPGMTPPATNPVGQAVSRSDILSWVRGAGPGSEIIYGYVAIIEDGGPVLLFGAERFSAPKTIDTPGQSLTLQVAVLLQSVL